MSQFWSAYEKWPPNNQLVVVLVALCALAPALFLAAWWSKGLLESLMRYCAIMVRGWPSDQWIEVPRPSAPALPAPAGARTEVADDGTGRRRAARYPGDAPGDCHPDVSERGRIRAGRLGYDELDRQSKEIVLHPVPADRGPISYSTDAWL